MTRTTNAKDVLIYLHRLCRELDEGAGASPFLARSAGALAVPAAVALGGLTAGCDWLAPSVELYGAPVEPPTAEICTDGKDNDSDGLIDCQDPWCTSQPACQPRDDHGAVSMYGTPFHMGKQPPPPPIQQPDVRVPMYGAPFPGDIQREPSNPDSQVPAYGAPFPGAGAGDQPPAPPPEPLVPDEPTPAVEAYGAPFPGDPPNTP
jgi:hypothetical protein